MIRRLRRKKAPLTIDEYVHRATLGLPRAERLDAATELRAHLLERVAEYQAQGYAREEAEFLAVRGMGEVGDAHPQLWCERLRKAGWIVLGVITWYAGGTTAYREWFPPREGVKLGAANSDDIARIFALADAPRGSYQAATLTLPQGTKTLIYVNAASPLDKRSGAQTWVYAKNIADEVALTMRGKLPGSYRYQERWLWTTERLTCEGKPSVRFYVTAQTQPSRFWNSGVSGSSDLSAPVNACDGPHLALRQLPPSADIPESRVVAPDGEGGWMAGDLPLKFGEWTVLWRMVVDPKQNPNEGSSPPRGNYSQAAQGVFLAVMPLDRVIDNPNFVAMGTDGKVRMAENGRIYRLPPFVPNVSDIGLTIPAQPPKTTQP